MKDIKKIYIILFIILYLFVALVSGIHGFAFFGLANTPILAGMLAIAFEIGQAAVLFSILTDSNQRKKFMPWLLMGILTLVQVMGNVFNCYKYLIMNAGDNLKFFKEPIFIWTQLPDAQANVILSYIQGAILPICALLLTSMVAGFLHKDENEEIEEIEEIEEEPDDEEVEFIDEGDGDETKPNFLNKIISMLPKKKEEKVEEETEEEPVEPYNSLSGAKLPEEEKEPLVDTTTTPIVPIKEKEPPKENPSDDEDATKKYVEEPDDNPEDKANDECVEMIEEPIETMTIGGINNSIKQDEALKNFEKENQKSHFINL